MRGTSHAQLVQADNRHYVVKYRRVDRPCRHLINEWLGARLLAAVGLPAAPTVLMDLGPSYSDQVSVHETLAQSGHVGALCPGADPSSTVIFDFFPEQFFGRVANLHALIDALPADLWLCNSENRQAIFWRDREKRDSNYWVWLIDGHGLFGGANWSFENIVALYRHTSIYDVDVECYWRPMIDRIENLPDSVVDEIFDSVPPAWIPLDGTFQWLRQQLLDRRYCVRSQLGRVLAAGLKPPKQILNVDVRPAALAGPNEAL